MIKSKETKTARTIAEQWNCNASSRLHELNSGLDLTYKNILCPVFLKLLKTFSPGPSIIDVGCGLGFLSDYVRRKGFTVTGVDMAGNCIAIAQTKFPQITFVAEDVVRFSKRRDKVFDASIANMLFHNVPNPAPVASAIFKLLRPGGVLIGCVPHPSNWFDRRRQEAKQVYLGGTAGYFTPFKIRGAKRHPQPFTYFHRQCDEYWKVFKEVGFHEIAAVSLDNAVEIPEDLVFFVAKKSRRGLSRSNKRYKKDGRLKPRREVAFTKVGTRIKLAR